MSRPILFAAVAALGLAAVLYAFRSADVTPAAPAPEGAAEEAPSASNVAPGIHVDMMRLKTAAAESPNDLDAQLAFARMALGAHRGADAAEALERAVSLDPDARQPWVDLALAYAAAEEWDASAEASRRMLARFPDDPEGRYNLGAAHANAGRLAEARAAWEAVPEGSETSSLARSSLVRLASLEASPAPAAATGAPSSPQTPAALPPGHPPIPRGHPPIGAASPAGACTSGTCADGGACEGDCEGGCACGGIETRVVQGGAADSRPLRTLVTALAGE